MFAIQIGSDTDRTMNFTSIMVKNGIPLLLKAPKKYGLNPAATSVAFF